jgi:hypothetical protein
VGADVEPAGVEVEAQQVHRLLAQRALGRHREGPAGSITASPAWRRHVADQAGQPLPQLAEDARHLGRRMPGSYWSSSAS